MIISRLAANLIARNVLQAAVLGGPQKVARRFKTHYRSGAVKPMPEQTPFGIVGVLCVLCPGLFIGAAISKSVANFLEENDLFVPSDDDDDED